MSRRPANNTVRRYCLLSSNRTTSLESHESPYQISNFLPPESGATNSGDSLLKINTTDVQKYTFAIVFSVSRDSRELSFLLVTSPLCIHSTMDNQDKRNSRTYASSLCDPTAGAVGAINHYTVPCYPKKVLGRKTSLIAFLRVRLEKKKTKKKKKRREKKYF